MFQVQPLTLVTTPNLRYHWQSEDNLHKPNRLWGEYNIHMIIFTQRYSESNSGTNLTVDNARMPSKLNSSSSTS